MRLWSIHPKYLDRQGLLAVWREGLLAKKVLEGQTKGYTRHPELDRFKQERDPVAAINAYLSAVLSEAERRRYRFDRSKIGDKRSRKKIHITEERALFELEHLKKKLKERSPEKHHEVKRVKMPELHPSFVMG